MAETPPSAHEPSPDPATLTAGEAASLMAAGDLTSEALVRACLARIRERDADVAAFAHFDEARVLADARACDAARQRGESESPIAGIPVAIKDIIDTAGYPTENGTPIFAGRRPENDASVVAQLKAAGAIIFGKTVTTELAFFGPRKTKNPHDPSRTPGGSSSGSAAAVADGQVPLAIGTQTAGSLIRPASYCGVIGFKPTFGAVSRTGVLAQSAPLDTIGGYARSVADIALLMDAISGFDGADPDMTPTRVSRLTVGLDEPFKRALRFAFVKSPAWPNADADARQAYEAFAAGFGARAEVVELELPAEFDGSLRLQQIVQFSDIARNYGPIADANPALVSAKLKEIIAEGRSFSTADYAAARAERDPLYEALCQKLDGYNAILTPAAQGVALAGLASTGSPMFNALWTYLGMPCISLPLLKIAGLPLGVQLVGLRDGDCDLLRAAKWMMAEAPLAPPKS
jgi:Asp-tRNA(Asn)/Glu-tRNA(Gln) amidotransferase A subunit family amidase